MPSNLRIERARRIQSLTAAWAVMRVFFILCVAPAAGTLDFRVNSSSCGQCGLDPSDASSSNGVAILYMGHAYRLKLMQHNFTQDILPNHRKMLWEPLQRMFGSVRFFAHMADEGKLCKDEFLQSAPWVATHFISAETGGARAYGPSGAQWFSNISSGESFSFVIVTRADIIFRKPVDTLGLDMHRINVMHWEDHHTNDCGDEASCEKKCRKTSDVFFALPWVLFSAWIPSTLHRSITGPREPEFGTWLTYLTVAGKYMSYLTSCCLRDHALAFQDVFNVLDKETHACHNTRHMDWEPNYYIYGMRICGSMARPGEGANEPCLTNPHIAARFSPEGVDSNTSRYYPLSPGWGPDGN